MKAGDLREMQRDLESGRAVDPDRLRRAIEFAADVAQTAERFSLKLYPKAMGNLVERMLKEVVP